MAKIVEQVDNNGNIIFDYDTSITITEIYQRIFDSFPGIYKDNDGMICGEHNGNKYSIRAKNITYLGHPHPLFKKRIQIPIDFPEFYSRSIEKNMTPILLGIYTYKDVKLFCSFKTSDFIDGKAHNSSAHIYSGDLSNAQVDHVLQKIDYFNNSWDN